jgi:hypothetical protein
MKIGFNLVRCGLGNNGGSQTIIRMALALKKLGHDVKILLDIPNKFTWFDFDQNILNYNLIYSSPENWPKLDIIIATACTTVFDVLKYPHLPIEKKFYWIRAHEDWAMSDEKLWESYKSGLHLLVNSEWQKENIYKNIGISSKIQYSGLPIEEIASFNHNFKKKDGFLENIIIGALYSRKPRKSFKTFVDIVKHLLFKGLVGKIYTFGNRQLEAWYMRDDINYEHLIRPLMKDKIALMRKCDIWISTTINEGCHIPPMEAGLCGCNIVVKGVSSAGVSDYAVEGVTAKTYFTVSEAVERIEEYMYNPAQRYMHQANLQYVLKNKIGNIEENAKRFERLLFNN